mmetsp:Transcript_66653/g.180220  ORF Transcript_66653/g.180220 Transcript_66653/m.180220 type:complete len:93 (+) Transcript_66653:567-845(+)
MPASAASLGSQVGKTSEWRLSWLTWIHGSIVVLFGIPRRIPKTIAPSPANIGSNSQRVQCRAGTVTGHALTSTTSRPSSAKNHGITGAVWYM